MSSGWNYTKWLHFTRMNWFRINVTNSAKGKKKSMNVQCKECVNTQIGLCTKRCTFSFIKAVNCCWDMNTYRKHVYVSSTSTLNFISSFKSITTCFTNNWCFSTENEKHCSKWEIKATVVFLMDVNIIYAHVYQIFTLSFFYFSLAVSECWKLGSAVTF